MVNQSSMVEDLTSSEFAIKQVIEDKHSYCEWYTQKVCIESTVWILMAIA